MIKLFSKMVGALSSSSIGFASTTCGGKTLGLITGFDDGAILGILVLEPLDPAVSCIGALDGFCTMSTEPVYVEQFAGSASSQDLTTSLYVPSSGGGMSGPHMKYPATEIVVQRADHESITILIFVPESAVPENESEPVATGLANG